MKLKLLLTLCLMVLPIGLQAAEGDNYVAAGLRFDDGITRGSGGFAVDLGNSIHEYTFVNFGDYQTLGTKLMVITSTGQFWGGVVAGPNFDFGNLGSPLTYFTGATGLTGGYWFNDKVGVAGYAEYKFSFSGDDLYVNSLEAGVGVTADLGMLGL